MTHVFISYSRSDSAYAGKLADHLIGQGFDVWIDDRLAVSEEWWPTIVKAIDECSAFAVIMTPASFDSKWVKREVGLADGAEKPMFPILLKGENWPIFVATQYEAVQDGKMPSDEFVLKLSEHLPRSGAGHRVRREHARPPTSPKVFPRSVLMAGSLLLALLIVGSVALRSWSGMTSQLDSHSDAEVNALEAVGSPSVSPGALENSEPITETRTLEAVGSQSDSPGVADKSEPIIETLALEAGPFLEATVSAEQVPVHTGPGVNFELLTDLDHDAVVPLQALDGEDVWIEFDFGRWIPYYLDNAVTITRVEPVPTFTLGMDVSHHQRPIDWQRVAAAGYRYVFVRATYGSKQDRRFAEHWDGAKAAGLLVSAYHFFRESDPTQEQIDAFFEVLGERRTDLPLVLDVETDPTPEVLSDDVTELVGDMLKEFERRDGRRPIIYSASSFWNVQMAYSSAWKKYPLWVAHYSDASIPRMPRGWPDWVFWQFTPNGQVDGAIGNMNLSRFNGDYNALRAFAGLSPVESPVEQTEVDEAPISFSITTATLPVHKGPGRRFSEVGALKMGDIITIMGVEGREVWAKIAPERWVPFMRDGVQYLELK